MRSQQDIHGTQEAAAAAAATAGPERHTAAGSRQRRLIVRGIELAAVARYLGSRRFLERAIVGAICLAALAGLARENEARAVSRLVGWERRRNLIRQRPARARRHAAG